MKIFITGGTGFIGGNFVKHLLASDMGKLVDKIYLLSRSIRTQYDSRVVSIVGEIENSRAYSDKLMESDFLFHFAGVASLAGKCKTYNQNYLMTKVLLDVLQDSSKIKKIIFLSSIMAYGKSKTQYGISKAISEKLIIDSGIPYVIFRPCFVYGIGMRKNSHLMILKRIAEKKRFPIYLNFPGRVSMIHVDDLSKALILSTRFSNRTFIATTETYRLKELLSAMVMNFHGKIIRGYRIPDLVCLLMARLTPIIGFKYTFMFTDYFLYEDKLFKDAFFANESIKSFFESELIKRLTR